MTPQNPQMRMISMLSVTAMLLLSLHPRDARADDVLYRCESAAGISIQGAPCPKESAQRKIPLQRPAVVAPVPAPASATPAAAAPATAPAAAVPAMPLTPASAMRGPNDPYPLWVCMRADGSTFDSRTGVAGKQWVLKPADDAASADGSQATAASTKSSATPKLHDLIVRPVESAGTVDPRAAGVPTPPPPGAAPGQWVEDQCVRLDPQQACDRFATRRDALRQQIYAAKPSERATYAPEEQDLTSMLFAACQR